MCRSGESVEDRIFELLDSDMIGREICAELGLEIDSGIDMIIKVIKERGTPNLVAARAAMDRMAAIQF